MRLLPLLCLSCCMAAPASAAVYRCEQQGRVVFTDRPCHARVQALELAEPTVLEPEASADLARAHDERAARERKAKAAADRDFLERHAARRAEDARLRSALVEGRVVAGMSPDQVRQVWGSPAEVEPRVSGGKTQERWIYVDGPQRRTVTFTDGVVTAASGKKR